MFGIIGICVIIAVAIAGAKTVAQTMRGDTPWQIKHSKADAIRDFIAQNDLNQCEIGFYGRKEQDAAALLGISENEAYQLITLELNKQQGKPCK